MKEKKQIIISILVLLITIFAILGVFIKEENFFLNNYKKQSISVLNEYKNGKIERNKVSEKLGSLSEKLKKEYNNNNNIGIMCLQSKLSTLALEIKYEEMSDSEIKEHIQEIKDIK